MGTPPAISQSVEVPVGPGAAFELYTAGINRWWKRDSWYWNDRQRARGLRIEPFVGGRFVEVYDEATGEEMEIEVGFVPAGRGTLVTIEVRGWERLTGGAEIGRGYGEGAKELLGWFAEAAAAG
jgi:hypothetical protein